MFWFHVIMRVFFLLQELDEAPGLAIAAPPQVSVNICEVQQEIPRHARREAVHSGPLQPTRAAGGERSTAREQLLLKFYIHTAFMRF